MIDEVFCLLSLYSRKDSRISKYRFLNFVFAIEKENNKIVAVRLKIIFNVLTFQYDSPLLYKIVYSLFRVFRKFGIENCVTLALIESRAKAS